MKANFNLWNKQCVVDFSAPISIHLPLNFDGKNPECFHVAPPEYAPLKVGNYVGSVLEGGSCNCEVLTLTPHGQGTHTECVGHLTQERRFIRDSLQQTLMTADLISIVPEILEEDLPGTESKKGDHVITRNCIEKIIWNETSTAIIIRTLPNREEKKLHHYSGQNPTYFTPGATEFLREKGYLHLLCDLPSVDREEDAGLLLAHKAWWNYPYETRNFATITELIFVPNNVEDGQYVLQISVAPLASDASPSSIFLYAVES
jgi:kynurenine formamidase